MRDSVNVVKNSFQLLPIPLKCQTQKVCFVVGTKDDCSKYFTSADNAKRVVIKDRNDLKKNIADLSYQCWDTLGRGYLQYQPIKKTSWSTNYCAPCYRFAFSDDLAKDKQFEKFTYDEINKYMDTNPVPNPDLKQTYYQFLANGQNYNSQNTNKEFLDSLGDTLDLNKQYMVITVMNKDGLMKIGLGAALGLSAGIAVVALTDGVGLLAFPVTLGGLGTGIGFKSTAAQADFLVSKIAPYDPTSLGKNGFNCDEPDFQT
jgi:hypothetical protein